MYLLLKFNALTLDAVKRDLEIFTWTAIRDHLKYLCCWVAWKSHVLWINLEHKNIHDKGQLSQVVYERSCDLNFANLVSIGKVPF